MVNDLTLRATGAVASLPTYDRQPDVAAALHHIDPTTAHADTALIARIGAGVCLRRGILPWRQLGGATVILAPDAAMLADADGALRAAYGPLRFMPCDARTIRAGLRLAAGHLLVAEAETRVTSSDSCRDLGPRGGRLALGLALACGLIFIAPLAVMSGLLVWAALALALNTGLRIAALFVSRPVRIEVPEGPLPARLPVVSLLVPLLDEREIAATLLQNLAALDYPQDRLDICLILEESDHTTTEALARATLPDHFQIVTVPQGTVRTKPRAMNFALGFTHGTIIGIYDAEDRPAPDQLMQVVRAFASAGPRIGCLQGALDYYNQGSNWLARCFTLEYAAWFRVILPGLARLGLVVPLGGTTLFLRRHVLEEVGGWDAHNVTEDADLGIRLARHGWQTALIATTTEEEANARVWPWIRQRTRWLKGYAMTWAVHNRDPVRLWRDLGPWRFFGLQVLLLGTISQFLLAPLFWSFWLLSLGLPHGLAASLPVWLLWLVIVLFLAAELTNALAAGIGAQRAEKARLAWWIPALHVYFPMATVAAWRAIWQAMTAPFRWEKTAHGIFVGTAPTATNSDGELFFAPNDVPRDGSGKVSTPFVHIETGEHTTAAPASERTIPQAAPVPRHPA